VYAEQFFVIWICPFLAEDAATGVAPVLRQRVTAAEPAIRARAETVVIMLSFISFFLL
jgi:hypothetical protein